MASSRWHHCESRFDYHQACRKHKKSRCHFRQSTQHVGPHQQGCFILLLPSTSTTSTLPCIAQDVRQRLVSALVFSRVDSCNSSLAGLSASTLTPLQRVLNAATRFVDDLRPRDHVTSVQRSPTGFRFVSAYNTNCVFWCTVLLMGMCPIKSAIWPHWHQLRRVGHIFALLTASPLTSLRCGQGWATGHCQSLVHLPGTHFRLTFAVHLVWTVDTFKKHLKAHLFSAAYNI